MATGNYNSSSSTAPRLKQFAANGAARDLVAASPDGHSCARMLRILGAGSFTAAKDGANAFQGTDTGTIGPLASGADVPGSFSEVISADAAFIAFY